MSPLSFRLNDLAKRVALLERDGSPDALAALLRLDATLAEVEALLPPCRRGRPKKAEFPQDFMAGLIDVLKTLPELGIKTDKDALRWLARTRKGKAPTNLKTWRNRLSQARKRR